MAENGQRDKTAGGMRPQYVIYAIMLGVLVWGAFHAVGAYLLNYNPWRPVMVLGATLAFLGFWAWLLRSAGPQRRG